jgi:hypothetical protein
MDPTANLAEALVLAEKLVENGGITSVRTTQDAERLAELVLDLHAWIQKGGFLPQQWKL